MNVELPRVNEAGPASSPITQSTHHHHHKIHARAVYTKSLLNIINLSAKRMNQETISIEEWRNLARESETLATHCTGNLPLKSEMLSLATTKTADFSMYHNPVNTTIIALCIADEIGQPHLFKRDLALAGLMHELSMCPFLPLQWLHRPLNTEERQLMEHHTEESALLASEATRELPTSPRIVAAVFEEHERMDGSGYPHKLRESQISEPAKILGLADTFESLTHIRPHRHTRTPSEAMGLIMAQREKFSRESLNALLALLTRRDKSPVNYLNFLACTAPSTPPQPHRRPEIPPSAL